MRTTLDIADDVLHATRERAQREGKTMGEMLSELARAALLASPATPARRQKSTVHGFVPFPSRGGIVTNEIIDRLREDDAY